VIDNYDSFVYNLVQYLGELGAHPIVVRNDKITTEEALALAPDCLIISPGPGTPDDAGISLSLIESFADQAVPILGVCLGHQCIGQFYGSTIIRASTVMHGKTSLITHDGLGLYQGLPNPLTATRYHSLVIDPESINSQLLVTSRSEDGTIMGIRHKDLPIEGVQFHPESILTDSGHQLLKNFLEIVTLARV
jgi:anthranilate synthase/aminodeoxychorismate synthase-like glutamine amidotransferase